MLSSDIETAGLLKMNFLNRSETKQRHLQSLPKGAGAAFPLQKDSEGITYA